jgi:hypothetical protein
MCKATSGSLSEGPVKTVEGLYILYAGATASPLPLPSPLTLPLAHDGGRGGGYVRKAFRPLFRR